MKYTVKTEILPILFLALAFALSGYFYANFPDQVITHWNFYGQPDGYSSRAFGAWFLPVLMTAMYAMFLALPRLDPKRDRYESFSATYHRFKTLFLLVFLGIHIIAGLANLGVPIRINLAIPFAVGSLFIILGNYMGKVKQNWFIGFRFPWTLSSENVWNKTHRVGGLVMILSGIVIMITPMFPMNFGVPLFIFSILAMTLGTMAYSYILFRREQKGTDRI